MNRYFDLFMVLLRIKGKVKAQNQESKNTEKNFYYEKVIIHMKQ